MKNGGIEGGGRLFRVRRFFRHVILSVLLAFGIAGAVEGGGTVFIQAENDISHQTDRYYTHGIRLRYLFPEKTGGRRYGIDLGQRIYTPESVRMEDPPRNDHPYAGALHVKLTAFETKGTTLDALSVAAGVVGPSAAGEQTQKFIHRIVNEYEPEGWDHQLHDEPIIGLCASRVWRIPATKTAYGCKIDCLPRFGLSLGNELTALAAGVEARIGTPPLGGFGVPLLTDIVDLQDPETESVKERGFIVFIRGTARVVFHDIFLDGNTFRKSRFVEKKPFVGEIAAGLSLFRRGYRLDLTHVIRTRRFAGQHHPERYVSVALTLF